MTSWKRYYEDRVKTLPEEEFLAQVGHTVNGRPIGQDEFRRLVDQIFCVLDPGPQDRLLDLCCGNGLFTANVARRAGMALGVDNSSALIEVARKHHHGSGKVDYLEMDIFRLGKLAPDREFDKILMYAALQHFSPDAFEAIFDDILRLAAPDFAFMIGFVPDRARRLAFYDSWQRRRRYIVESLLGRHRFGHWWPKTRLERLCRERGLSCEFLPLPPGPHAATYRFHAVIRPPA